MLNEEPDKIIYDLLRTEWNVANTTYTNDPKFQTGWYDYGSDEPQVSVTEPGHSVVDGGDTNISAITGSGGVVQRLLGTVLVNCWSGTFQDTRSAGAGNPKNAAFQMAQEARRILLGNAQGTRKPDGSRQLWTIAPGEARRRTEDDEDPTIFRYEVTTAFVHVDRT